MKIDNRKILGKKRVTAVVLITAMMFLTMVPSGNAGYPEAPVVLGSAGDFVILAKAGISTTGATSIIGDIGGSPIDSTAITGFGLIMDSSNQFATSSLVTGKVYAADYAAPTPTIMTASISDMETAYTDAAGRTSPDHTELGAGNIGGMTLTPGLYKWGTGVTIPTDVTLSGNSDAVWIFQIAQDLDISSAAQIILSGGAQAKNIFWQVAGQTTLGTASVFNGNILCQTTIVLNTGATLNGRALAQTAVTLDANTITMPHTDVTPPTPAAFTLSNLAVSPVTVEPGATVTVTVQVQNTGDEQGSTPVELKINGVTEDTETATLDAGASATVTFTVSRSATGSYTVTVGSLTGSFTVKASEPPPAGIPWVGTWAGVLVVVGYILCSQRRPVGSS